MNYYNEINHNAAEFIKAFDEESEG